MSQIDLLLLGKDVNIVRVVNGVGEVVRIVQFWKAGLDTSLGN